MNEAILIIIYIWMITLTFLAVFFIVRLKNENKALRNQKATLESENDQLIRNINYHKAVNKTLSEGLNHFTNNDKK